jgi:hypothetical protein
MMKRLLLLVCLVASFRVEAATTYYLRSSTSEVDLVNTQLDLNTSRGAGSVNSTCTTNASTSVPMNYSSANVTWFTPPLTGVTVSGTITANIRAYESAVQANAGIRIKIERTDTHGTPLSIIAESTFGSPTELTTSDAAKNWSPTTTSTTLSSGDRIKVTLTCVNAGTMGSGQTVYVTFNGASAAAAGDSYVTFTETITTYTVSTNKLADTLKSAISTIGGVAKTSLSKILGRTL